jgi:DNA (cytosine-5)-methyltransferase 1
MDTKNNTFIEVFAGCGGLSLGLINAGFKPLLLVDNVKDCVKTLEINHPDANVQNIDVTKLHLDDYKNKVYILAGGIPCQSWSLAGKRKGLDDKRGNLFIDFIRLIKECKPDIFVIENVHGLLTHNKGETFKTIKELLSINNTYGIDYKLLNANEYDVPQKRKRVFIIGTKNKLELVYEFPQSFNPGTTLVDAFKDISECFENPIYPQKKLKLFRKIPQGGCWINLSEEEQREYLGKSMDSGGGKRGILRRLSMDTPSLTLLTTHSQKQTERCHPLEDRPLNIKEYARIQTFPDDYVFHGSLSSRYKQIGNAVPVNLAYHIGLSIMDIGYAI